jgi:hypothetical protein
LVDQVRAPKSLFFDRVHRNDREMSNPSTSISPADCTFPRVFLFFEKNKHICLKKATIYTFLRLKRMEDRNNSVRLGDNINKKEVNP